MGSLNSKTVSDRPAVPVVRSQLWSHSKASCLVHSTLTPGSGTVIHASYPWRHPCILAHATPWAFDLCLVKTMMRLWLLAHRLHDMSGDHTYDTWLIYWIIHTPFRDPLLPIHTLLAIHIIHKFILCPKSNYAKHTGLRSPVINSLWKVLLVWCTSSSCSCAKLFELE